MFKFKPTDEWYKRAAESEENYDISAGKDCLCDKPDLYKNIELSGDNLKVSQCFNCHGFTFTEIKDK